ncbi:MAG: efflux RND transporter periplasmic adaptor subunit [Anaerolineae bacterium]
MPEKPTYTVNRGTIVNSISFTGRIAPAIEEPLFFRESGRVKKVYVSRNDMVEAGTPLAELENDDLVRQLAQTEIELETAAMDLESAQREVEYTIQRAQIALEVKRLQYAKLLEQTNQPDVEIAKANLQRAEAAVKAAQKEYDVYLSAGAALALEQATIDYQIATANLKRAVDSADQIKLDLQIQQKDLALAELDLEHLKSNAVNPQLSKNVERAKLAVERLKAQVANTQVLSPIAGKVTSVSCYDGRTVEAYKTVFLVADENKLEVSAEPMSTQLKDLMEGMESAIILSAYPGKELPGKIIQLPYPYGSGGGASLEEADKATHIEFDPQDLDVSPGDLVKVIVTLEQKENALWLPPAAIRTFAGRKFVEIEDDGVRRRVDVRVGIESGERVEILEGTEGDRLEEGQVVLGQ